MPYGEKSAYEAQAKLKGKSSIKKKVGFGMPYQGNHSAFPFKQSPIKQFEFDAAASVACKCGIPCCPAFPLTSGIMLHTFSFAQPVWPRQLV